MGTIFNKKATWEPFLINKGTRGTYLINKRTLSDDFSIKMRQIKKKAPF